MSGETHLLVAGDYGLPMEPDGNLWDSFRPTKTRFSSWLGVCIHILNQRFLCLVFKNTLR